MGFKKRSKDRLKELLYKGFVNGKADTVEELTDYLDKNGVIVPACAIGEKVYVAWDDGIHETKVHRITLTSYKKSIFVDIDMKSYDDSHFHYGGIDECIGFDTAFKTKREAIRWQKAQKGE